MAAEPEEAKTLKRAATSSVRATISFPSALYEALEELAKQSHAVGQQIRRRYANRKAFRLSLFKRIQDSLV
jgi:hypothetical protein